MSKCPEVNSCVAGAFQARDLTYCHPTFGRQPHGVISKMRVDLRACSLRVAAGGQEAWRWSSAGAAVMRVERLRRS